MAAYYNEYDRRAAAWLRELIADGLIADGEVDERSITDVTANDVKGFVQCHFFAGIGGWSYGLRLAGWPDDRPVWTGSCPCQPFSVAGQGGGLADERHLWPAFRWLIAQCRPATVFGEQVASSDGRSWLAGVRADLEVMGYRCGAADLCAAGVGAPHIRQRLWWVANSDSDGWRPRRGERAGLVGVAAPDGTSGVGGMADTSSEGRFGGENRTAEVQRQLLETSRPGHRSAIGGMADADISRRDSQHIQSRQDRSERHRPAGQLEQGCPVDWPAAIWHECRDGKQRRIPAQPELFPLVNGLPGGRVGLLRGAGNAIVPQCAEAFIRAAMGGELI